MAFLVLAIVIGASCAIFRHRVATVLALSALLGVVVVLSGVTAHVNAWVIVAQAVGAITAIQFVYVAVGLTVHFLRFRKLIPHVQATIGRRLRAELEIPRSLPPQLSALIGRLEAS